jgi:hypothetical protein
MAVRKGFLRLGTAARRRASAADTGLAADKRGLPAYVANNTRHGNCGDISMTAEMKNMPFCNSRF